MSVYIGFGIFFLFIGIVASVYCIDLKNRLKEAEQQLEPLRESQKELVQIMGCTNFGIGRRVRELREYNLNQVTNFFVPPDPARLELDLKTDILLSKLALWGNHNKILGSFDLTDVHHVETNAYELQAIRCQQEGNVLRLTNLLYRINDQSKLMRKPSQLSYVSLIKSK